MSNSLTNEPAEPLDSSGETPGWYLQIGLDYLGPFPSRAEAEQRWQSFFTDTFAAVRPAVLEFR